MREVRHSPAVGLSWLSFLEVLTVALLAAVLTLIGPLLLVVRFFSEGHEFASFAVGLAWVAVFLCCLLELRRHKFGWACLTIIVAWLVSVVLVVNLFP